MSTAELNEIKLNLIGWINQLSDTDLISFLEGIRKSRSEGDWWSELNPEQKKVVLSGLEDAENGKLLSSQDFWKKLKNA